MNYERINELENFVEDFNKKLEEAQKTYEMVLYIKFKIYVLVIPFNLYEFLLLSIQY